VFRPYPTHFILSLYTSRHAKHNKKALILRAYDTLWGKVILCFGGEGGIQKKNKSKIISDY
jgi:hypothetical protein